MKKNMITKIKNKLFQIFLLFNKLLYSILIFLKKYTNRFKKIKNQDVVFFYLPSKLEYRSGGILSIFNLIEVTKEISSNWNVYLIFLSKKPKVLKYRWFKNNVEITYLYLLRNKVDFKNIIVHVPECFVNSFLDEWKSIGFDKFNEITTINILNQNNLLMPEHDGLINKFNKFKLLTVTLAFEKDIELFKNSKFKDSYYHLSAWFYNTKYEIIPFEEKLDIILISPDKHLLRDEIIKKLSHNRKYKLVEVIDMSYEKFKFYQKYSKWSLTFGEGFDNYFIGQFHNGGIGFSVYNEQFFSNNFNTTNLPECVFESFEDLLCNIDIILSKYDNKLLYESLSNEVYQKIAMHNSKEMVSNNLKKYYDSIFIKNSGHL
jgi:hypothetical protein